MWPWNLMNDLEKNCTASLLYCITIGASFQIHRWIQTGVTVRKRSIRVKIGDFSSRVTLKIDGWPWKTTGLLSYAASSFVNDFIAIDEFKLALKSRNAQFGYKSTIFQPSDLWQMTLKSNRVPFLSNIKLCAAFHHLMWIQTGVTVRKRLNGVMSSVTLTFNRWPLPIAWTSVLSSILKFHDDTMMGTWWKKCDRQTDRWSDGRKRPFIELLGRS